jgi:rubredoxin
MKCIVCGNEIKELEPEPKDSIPPYVGMWDDATVELIIPGYGSKRDGQRLIIGLCDGCIEDGIKSGSIHLVNEVERQAYQEFHNRIK